MFWNSHNSVLAISKSTFAAIEFCSITFSPASQQLTRTCIKYQCVRACMCVCVCACVCQYYVSTNSLGQLVLGYKVPMCVCACMCTCVCVCACVCQYYGSTNSLGQLVLFPVEECCTRHTTFALLHRWKWATVPIKKISMHTIYNLVLLYMYLATGTHVRCHVLHYADDI